MGRSADSLDAAGAAAQPRRAVYDRRRITYASSFDSTPAAFAIRMIERLTGRAAVLRMVRDFERRGAPSGQRFWSAALDTMGIRVQTPPEQIARIPAAGPVVLVANHPHGLVDGMVLAEMIGRRRPDYRIVTRALLAGIDEAATSFMIPAPFPHDPDAREKFVEMRRSAMRRLETGGLVGLFPSGAVASSDTLFGPPVEREWSVFTAQLIRRSGATVVPVFFPGSNSRAYQIAGRISATLRQGLLIHEVVASCHRPQRPVVGAPIGAARTALLDSDPRGFMAWLRAHTLSLGAGGPPGPDRAQRVGCGASPE